MATRFPVVEAYCLKHGLSLHTQRLKTRCNRCSSEYVTQRRRERKEAAAAFFGYRCHDCGITPTLRALHFDHVEGKEFAISRKAAMVSLDVFWTEIHKCVLRCAVCHRLRHAAGEARLSCSHESKASRCQSCKRLYLFQLRRALWETAIREFGNQCEMCGRQGPTVIFDFHHLDPHLKTISPSRLFAGLQYKKLATELTSCALLCANCHADVESSDFNVELVLRKRPSERELVDAFDLSTKPVLDPTLSICPVCTGPKDRQAKCCLKCFVRVRKIAWPPAEILVRRLNRETYEAVAKELGVSSNSIRSYIKRSGLEVPRKWTQR